MCYKYISRNLYENTKKDYNVDIWTTPEKEKK
jgi:hypothetical protein